MSTSTKHVSHSGFVHHYRTSPTDGSVNARNIAHAQESITRSKINDKKLYLMDQKETRDKKLFENKDKLDNIKIQRDAIQLRKEAREYWNSLTDAEREQYFIEKRTAEQAELMEIAHKHAMEDRIQEADLEVKKANLHQKELKEERKNQVTKSILKILPWYLLISFIIVAIMLIFL